ncbi:MAG TPA: hypothetical protein VG297_20705 [Bryobacteraceae bacterium]|nr:hypothetical protein [Bryobacteraceae bacterium]
MRTVALLLFALTIASAQENPRAIVARAVAADDHSDRLARDYTYKVRDEIREFDSAGKVKSTRSTLDEVLYIGGKEYFRPLEKDGKPITPAEAAKEQSKIDRAAAEASRMPQAERDKRLADAERERARRREEFKDIPDAFNFRMIGDVMIDGRPTWQIEAMPRAGYRGRGRNIFSSIEGTLWIDKQDYNWVKFDAEVLKPFSIGWFLARVAAGTHISYEMMRVGSSEKDELWVPKSVSLEASARIALLKRINARQNITFSDYRKFQTDSRIVATGETP